MENLERRSFEAIDYNGLAEELDILQLNENDGRGINCVRDIISSLRRSDLEDAKAISYNEADKISSYPEVKKFLVENLFKDEDKNPWSLFG
jgi:hypothetical protein